MTSSGSVGVLVPVDVAVVAVFVCVDVAVVSWVADCVVVAVVVTVVAV